MLEKLCCHCKEVKAVSEFFRNRRNSDGYAGYCKVCAKGFKRKGYAKNKDKINASRKIWRDNNKDKIREHGRTYRKNNRDTINQYRAEYYKENKDIINLRRGKYRKKRRTEDEFILEDWKGLLLDANYRCQRCGSKENLTVDHIMPLSLGGTNTIDNCQILCLTCNASKGNTDFTDYRKIY